jgi:hypothetical protein
MDVRDKYVVSQDTAFGFSFDVFQLDVASLNLDKVSGNQSPLSVFSSPVLM